MKILFITDNFPPEVNAPATRTYEHCVEWVKQGAEVTVITGFPNFPQGKVYAGYKNKWKQTEVIDGIKVIRVWTYITANEGFLKRIIDYISFSVSSFFAGLTVKTDIIVATSPQFFTALSGRWLSFFKQKPWIMEIRDLWPESAKSVAAVSNNIFFSFFEWLELRLYKNATRLITVTDTFKKKISERGIDSNKISVVKNGANLELYQAKPKNADLLKKLGLENKFVVGYIGTHGMAHKLDFILESITKIKDDTIHFLMIGDGAEKNNLLKLARKLDLKNVSFLAPVTKKEVPEYLSIIDVALVPLKKNDTFKTVIPSKIFEASSMQKPILLGVEGESQKIIEDFNAGLCFEPENEQDFLDKLTTLKNEPDTYATLQKGCKQLALSFDRKVKAKDMLKVIKETINFK